MPRLPNCYRCKSQPCECKDGITLYHADCRDILPLLEPGSVDLVLTDPPYGIGFMGKEFDTFKPSHIKKKTANHKPIDHKKQSARSASMHAGEYDQSLIGNRMFQEWCAEMFTAILPACKPGAMLASFGGTRTYHRLTCGIEDAGWEVRDCLMWLYGSGFPKSASISKQLDMKACREELAEKLGRPPTKEEFKTAWKTFRNEGALRTDGRGKWELKMQREKGDTGVGHADGSKQTYHETAPATAAAKTWEGYGTALKPAWEPIVLAMKPLDGTFAENALAHGVAGINVDGGRIGTTVEMWPATRSFNSGISSGYTAGVEKGPTQSTGKAPSGRWPANLILQHHEGCVRVGAKRVKAGMHGGKGDASKSGYQKGWDGEDKERGYADADGLEEVEAYECHPDCPIGILDRQAGTSQSTQGKSREGQSGDGWGMTKTGAEYADVGGPSRFFKTFAPELRCVLCALPTAGHDGIMQGTERNLQEQQSCNAQSADDSLSPSSTRGNSAGSRVQEKRPRGHGGKPERSSIPVNSAASDLRTSPEISESSAVKPAKLNPIENLVRNVKFAESLCDSCAIAIAQSIVAMQRGQSPDSPLGRVSISEPSKQILLHNLASLAESLENTDTIPTTEHLKWWFGSVLPAIADSTAAPITVSNPSRFRYQSKASGRDRGNLPAEELPLFDMGEPEFRNTHPTVKPLELIRYLLTLLYPPSLDAVCLDPFAGSGTTGRACKDLGRKCIMVEIEEKYCEIAAQRLDQEVGHWMCEPKMEAT